MPTLNWIGKEKVINHHSEVPFKVLEHKYGFTPEGQITTAANSGNKIIHGDNLEALKSLLPEFEGKIKCIYIDPPYNTGNENWSYNDNVNHPKIRKWLNVIVGKDGEDLSRHDKWLCMMYPRLRLLHKLLSEDGVIFISIDDNEEANLKCILEEIFGAANIIGKVCWFKKRKGSYLSKEFVSLTEYIYIFRKNKKLQLFGGIPNSEESQPLVKRTNNIGTLKFPAGTVLCKLNDGVYTIGTYGRGSSAVKLLNDIRVENGIIETEFSIEGPFIWSQSFLDNELNNGSEITINTINFQPRAFRNSEDKHKGFPSFLDGREFSATTDDAYETLKEIFDTDRIFDYSKPYQLVSYLINSITHFDKNAIVLDSFAGSGSTAHAVLELNMKDGGNRKFILIEMEGYAEEITSERVKRVIKGYNDKTGTGGHFNFYELGKPMFIGENNEFINEEIETEVLQRYIWYSETRTSFEQPSTVDTKFFLGKKEETAYYFIYEKNSATTLDYEMLSELKTSAGQYVIYADNCLLSKEFMLKKNIVFKKIPRDVTRF